MPEVHPEYTEGTEGAQKTCFWARLEGPAAWALRSFEILVACAFETFCELVYRGDSQNPQAPRDIL